MLDEDGQLVPPSEFIPVAERHGLMPQLTRWVVKRVVEKLRAHSRARLSVNLSAMDIADETLPEFIATYLNVNRVAPERLSFEITETAVIEDLASAGRWIESLRSVGCRFALDDFGAGFNSFGYLRNLPVDQIKIDGSLVVALRTDQTQVAMVKALQALADTLGKESVAEYVEDDELLRILREIGVTYGQGYRLGRPSPELVEGHVELALPV
jgi:EAL domain-containing protein (putative c-di-GMP-specific phosphodiesterase class I)